MEDEKKRRRRNSLTPLNDVRKFINLQLRGEDLDGVSAYAFDLKKSAFYSQLYSQ